MAGGPRRGRERRDRGGGRGHGDRRRWCDPSREVRPMTFNQFPFILLAIFAFIMLVSLARSARVVSQYEKGLVLRLGKYRATVSSGLTFLVPVIEDIIKVDMRERVISVEP